MDDPRLLAVRKIGAFFTGDSSVKTSTHHGRDESEILSEVLGEIILPQPKDIQKVRLVPTTLYQRDIKD